MITARATFGEVDGQLAQVGVGEAVALEERVAERLQQVGHEARVVEAANDCRSSWNVWASRMSSGAVSGRRLFSIRLR